MSAPDQVNNSAQNRQQRAVLPGKYGLNLSSLMRQILGRADEDYVVAFECWGRHPTSNGPVVFPSLPGFFFWTSARHRVEFTRAGGILHERLGSLDSATAVSA